RPLRHPRRGHRAVLFHADGGAVAQYRAQGGDGDAADGPDGRAGRCLAHRADQQGGSAGDPGKRDHDAGGADRLQAARHDQDRQGSLLPSARNAAGRGLCLCQQGDDREHAGRGSLRGYRRVPGKERPELAELALPQYPDTLIKSILREIKTIAMVGASGNDIRPSYFAMMYLLNKGYKIIPVNPGMVGKEILGQKVYASLKDVPAPVDMVDIFREAKFAPDIAREAVAEKDRLGLKILWMQLGVISEEAEKIAQDGGLTVVMNRCPKIEHGRFSGEIGWMGVNRRVIDNRKPLLFGRGGSLKHG